VWTKRAFGEWTPAAGINGGAIFRPVNRLGNIQSDRITPVAVWHLVKAAAKRADNKNLAPGIVHQFAGLPATTGAGAINLN
jgi:hypothetical protein